MFKKSKIKKTFSGRNLHFFLLVVIMLIFELPQLGAEDLIQAFDMAEVTISDPFYENALNKEIDYLLALEPNRLLVGFKQTAGISTSYRLYPSWESSLIQGHTMGHYMTALAQAYKNSVDKPSIHSELKSRMDFIINELEACQLRNGNGYLFATSPTQFDVVEGRVSGSSWVPWYTMHKIVAGLIDIYKLGGNSKALTLASNLGNWIYNRTNGWSSSMQSRVLGVEYGGMNDCLYELYKLTKNNNHLSAAHKFDEVSYFQTIANGNNVLNGKHANTQIPKFVGALNRYRALGGNETLYLNTAKSFWTMVLKDHTYVTGGNSQNEFFRTPGRLDGYRDNVNNETCNSYNMLKLARGLFQVTGEIKYADYYELAYINEILASQNPETGMTTYFKAMGTGYFKVFGSPFDHFWCCTGSGMENFSKLNDSIYFYSGTDLYVNMYISSRLNWRDMGFGLTQNTDIPLSDKAEFVVTTAASQAVTIKFRSPSWLAAGKSVTLRVNGSVVNAVASNGYISLNRNWSVGDKIELSLPADVKVSRLADNKNVVAFTYGPLVLSAGLGTQSMTTASHGVNVLKATKNVSVRESIGVYNSISNSVDHFISNINSNLVRTPGTLNFYLRNTDADSELTFTPHYKRYQDRYGIYFELTMVAGGPTPTPGNVATPEPQEGPLWSGGPYDFDGVADYADVPDGLFSDLDDFSIACRVEFNEISQWVRLFDFGTSTDVYMMFTPNSGNSGNPYFCLTTNGNAGEEGVSGTSPLETGRSYHIAIVKNGQNCILYIDGQEDSRNSAMTIKPSYLGTTINNFIGRSQWEHDPYLNASIEEFQIYNRAISETEIQSLVTGSPSGLLGDVDENQVVNIVDALLIAQDYVNLEITSNYNPQYADVNCDQSINIVDSLLVAQYYVNLISTFPCE